jgi:hypothetical protein
MDEVMMMMMTVNSEDKTDDAISYPEKKYSRGK